MICQPDGAKFPAQATLSAFFVRIGENLEKAGILPLIAKKSAPKLYKVRQSHYNVR
jgi:hypothetical protein